MKEEPKLMLPVPAYVEEYLEEAVEVMNSDEKLLAMVEALNDSDASPELIEYQMKLVEAEFEKEGRKVELFHKSVVAMKNERVDDERLESKEGTSRALRELAVYANRIQGLFKTYQVNQETMDAPEDEQYYWSV